MQERKPGCICELDEKTVEPLVADYEECPVHKPDAPDPKKEAERLVNEFSLTVDGSVSRECALIAVDEVLGILDTFQRHEYGKVLIPFYQQVKVEIVNYDRPK